MLQPQFANAAEISTFKYGKEDYVMVTFFFQTPPITGGGKTFRPPIPFIPVSTILIPREAYKAITKKFLGYVAQQEEGKILGDDPKEKPK